MFTQVPGDDDSPSMRTQRQSEVVSLVTHAPEQAPDSDGGTPGAAVRLTFLRRQPAQARGTRSVLEILKACESLLGEMQPDDITIELIATRARVQAGSIFFFFNDRLSIFFSVIELALRQLAAEYDFTDEEFALPLPAFLRNLDRRLQRIWDVHRTVMDLYFAYQAHPAISRILGECSDYMQSQLMRKLASEFKAIRKDRRSTLALVINQQLIHGHDVIRTLPKARIASFREEWLSVVLKYVAGLRG
jgi:AcrR family transcriptional regulator